MEAELKARVAELASKGAGLVLVEVPLLFETGREAGFDKVIVVAAPEALQIRRLQGAGPPRGGGDPGNSAAQWPLADKVARADYVVDNGGSRRHTQRQVKNIWGNLKNQLDSGGEKG